MSLSGSDSVLRPLPAAGCLEFLWPALSSAFHIADAVKQDLRDAVSRLASVPRIALELHLKRDRPPDLHQLLRNSPEDRAAAINSLRDPGIARSYPQGFSELLNHWAASDACPDLYLEWDFEHLGQAPALFFPLDIPPPDLAIPESLHSIAGRGLASIRHLGTMPNRGDVLRVNFRGIAQGHLATVLAALGWPGDPAAAARLFDELCETADRVILALNFRGKEIQPGLGLEIFFDESYEREPRWKLLFDHLLKLDLCSASEADCLLASSRRIHAYDSAHPWPAAWMLATELSAGGAVPFVDRALSHIKISLPDAGPPYAKAYLGVQHHWEETSAEALSARPTALGLCTDQSESERRALQFLLGRRQQSGWWREFRWRFGPSDEWATAFVACALLQMEDAGAAAAASEAAGKLLARMHRGGGWGWSQASPADADSTAWVLQLLQALHFDPAIIDRGLSFLRLHETASGGVATYLEDAYFESAARPPEDFRGWASEHDCVLANTAALLGETALDALAARQQADGSWQAYWWASPALATALAAEALSAHPTYANAVRSAVRWARDFQPGKPSAFIEAWLIRILVLDAEGDRRSLERRLSQLCAMQLADGSWAPSADLLKPDSNDATGQAAPEILPENFGIFATAAALAALAIARRALAQQHWHA